MPMQRRDFLKAMLATAAITSAPAKLFAQAEQAGQAGQAGQGGMAGQGAQFAAGPSFGTRYSVVDCHLHYLDFLQKSDGLGSLVAAMDACGVTQAVLFGMPMMKQWDASSRKKPAYYLSNDSRCYHYSATDYLMLKHLRDAPAEQRNRFLPFVCGVNVNDRNAADLLQGLLREFPGQIRGIGELMSRHDDLTALTYGEPPRADHPALLDIYDLAAENGLPVMLHHNISGANIDEPLYMEEMENALAHNRKTKIIWAHVGISRRVELSSLLETADGLLKRHSNLHFDISWIVFENYIAKNAESLGAWAALIEKRKNRFLLGTDVVGHWAKYSYHVTKYYPLLDKLSPDAANRLCRENILRLAGGLA